MFPPIFPISIPILAPLHPIAPFIWLGGVICLWLTRYTHQLANRWGAYYYIVSSLIRPIGILLIGLGWMGLFSPLELYGYPGIPSMNWLPRHNVTDVLCWLAILIFFSFGVCSVIVLGIRKSFLFRRYEDELVTAGPYRIVRHPQFLSAIGMSFFLMLLYNPADYFTLTPGAYLHSLSANWALFSLSLWLLTLVEERELLSHFGEAYRIYMQEVPRLLPL